MQQQHYHPPPPGAPGAPGAHGASSGTGGAPQAADDDEHPPPKPPRPQSQQQHQQFVSPASVPPGSPPVPGTQPYTDAVGGGSKPTLKERFYQWSTKAGVPINKITNKLGSEAFWPSTMDVECDKAARILQSFCSESVQPSRPEPPALPILPLP